MIQHACSHACTRAHMHTLAGELANEWPPVRIPPRATPRRRPCAAVPVRPGLLRRAAAANPHFDTLRRRRRRRRHRRRGRKPARPPRSPGCLQQRLLRTSNSTRKLGKPQKGFAPFASPSVGGTSPDTDASFRFHYRNTAPFRIFPSLRWALAARSIAAAAAAAAAGAQTSSAAPPRTTPRTGTPAGPVASLPGPP